MIYLDNAATTLRKPPEVEEAVIQAVKTLGNAGRGAHAPTLDASRTVYRAREEIAELFHAENGQRIAFTSNATEALNLVIKGLFTGGDHIISTVCEHNSVLRPLYDLENQGITHTLIRADREGFLDYDGLEKALRPETKAVVITHASNLTGNITDLDRIAAYTGKHHLKLIVDASQTAGCLPIDVQKYGIDVLCFTGHKGLMGPQGTGGIYVRDGISLRPLKTGGSGIHSFDRQHPHIMPEALEAGTLNTHGIAGLLASVKTIKRIGIDKIRAHEMELTEIFMQGIKEIPGVRFYGNPDTAKRVGIVSINIEGMDSGEVSDQLWDQYQICVRGGAHCAPLMHKALGTGETGAVRFSFSWYSTKEEILTALAAVKDLAEG